MSELNTLNNITKKHTLLIEIGTEELPSKSLRMLAEVFAIYIQNIFNIVNICYSYIDWFATPRRLAVKVYNLNYDFNNYDDKVNTFTEISKYNTHSLNVISYHDNLVINPHKYCLNKKDKYFFQKLKQQTISINILLKEIVSYTLKKIQIFTTMRWNNNTRFIRPVHTIIILLDDIVISGKILGICINRVSYGHRFMGNRNIYINHADQYPEILFSHGKVVANYFHRKNMIRKGIEEISQYYKGIVNIDDNLLEELTSLVEWPVVLTASFEKKFLSIPKEILICILQNHQKYFTIFDHIGNLLPYFIFVVNIISKDSKKIIIGNERVVKSRLIDAEFCFNLDRMQRLEDNLFHLHTILFQKSLGTLHEKSQRIQKLSIWIAKNIGADIFQSSRAGLLSKCDILTYMVSEFPETRGIIGMYYAQYDGESELVALAQKEQYQPRISNETLPTTLISYTVAIADRIDTLVGILGIGYHPKGSQDPFALRRAALGILRIIIEKKLSIDLQYLITESVQLYNNKLTNTTVIHDVINFIFDRVFYWYKEKGYRIDIIQSVVSQHPTKLIDFDARINAVNYFCSLPDHVVLIIANKRVSNILSKYHNTIPIDIQESILIHPIEIELASLLTNIKIKIQPILQSYDYCNAFLMLYTLCKPIDVFFKNVMVMVEDTKIRSNRLALLLQLRKLFLYIADISLLQFNNICEDHK